MKRAAIYVRMSTAHQADSPERQLSQILPYCQKQGYHIVNQGRYDDLAMTGDDDTRPGLRRLIEDAGRGLFEVVVVDEPERLSRNDPVKHILTIVGPLQQAGVQVDTVSAGLVDWEDMGGYLMASIRQFKSQQESASLGRRVATRFAVMAQAGILRLGRPPYGYRTVTIDGVPRLVLGDADKVQVVRDIYDAYVHRDLSVLDICRELESRGVPTSFGRKKWSSNSVYLILTEPAYYGAYRFGKAAAGKHYRVTREGVEAAPRKRGQRRHSGVRRRKPEEWVTLIEGAHEPIVSRELWEEAGKRLRANAQRKSKRHLGGYLFTGILRCAHCGEPFKGASSPRSQPQRKQWYYRCGSFTSSAAEGRNGRCGMRLVSEADVVEGLLPALEKAWGGDFIERARAQAAVLFGGQDGSRATALQKELDELREKIRAAGADLLDLPADLRSLAIEGIRKKQRRLTDIEVELASLADRPDFLGRVYDFLDELRKKVRSAAEVFRLGTRDEQRAWAQSTLQQITIRVERRPWKGKRLRYTITDGEVVLRAPDLPDGTVDCRSSLVPHQNDSQQWPCRLAW